MQLFNGDCLEVLKTLPDNSVDSMVTDPPAGIDFMNKSWDTDKGGNWTSWFTDVMKECHRVLKPGGHALVWALPRVSHKTGTALEDAGFEIRDVITHHYGTGFPKNLDLAKQLDKAAGAERKVVGSYLVPDQTGGKRAARAAVEDSLGVTIDKFDRVEHDVTEPATDDAKKWNGWGTALKPSSEFWWLVRKECSEKTIAANVLTHGVGGLNIDGSRISMGGEKNPSIARYNSTPQQGSNGWDHVNRGGNFDAATEASMSLGRYPTNLILSHTENCKLVGTKLVKTSMGVRGKQSDGGIYGGGKGLAATLTEVGQDIGYGDENGEETVESWECAEDCAIAELDRQSGVSGSGSGKAKISSGAKSGGGSWQQDTKAGIFKPGAVNTGVREMGDRGGASRFFYCPKASKSDRNRGGADNKHPTVKSTQLMRYLVKLITPPGGIVLDPFTGSGSTGVAAKEEGMDFIGIEQQPEYCEIARTRIGILQIPKENTNADPG